MNQPKIFKKANPSIELYEKKVLEKLKSDLKMLDFSIRK